MGTEIDAERLDVVIIGAGLYGIAAARTYLDVHPDCQLAILDQDSSVGGSWNQRRTYEAFWSQTGLRMTEFSDVPLELPPDEQTYHDTFQAKHVTTYLESYIDSHVYAGRSIRERLTFEIEVRSIQKEENAERWTVRALDRRAKTPKTFLPTKVMVATGVTSEPNMPVLFGKERFEGSIYHSESFGASGVLKSPDVQDIVVVGGGKSAGDMVYACAKAGKTVSWVVRKSGTGPAAFIDVKGRATGPLAYKNAAEIGCTRMMTALVPSAFCGPDWMATVLHRSKVGRAFGNKVWRNADRDIRNEADYHGRARTGRGFENLKTDIMYAFLTRTSYALPLSQIPPWKTRLTLLSRAYWCSGAVGLLQHRDFYDIIAEKVDSYRQDVSHLSARSICLANGTTIKCDALICGTGWKQSYPFFSDTQLCELGLPHDPSFPCLDDAAQWHMIQEAADCAVIKEYPKLAHPPPFYKKPMTKTPYRLYKCIASLDDDSIVFLGQLRIASNFRVAECQALWATAYLDHKLDLPGYEDMQAEIAYVNAWCRRRYPANGGLGNYLHYDVIAYTDALLARAGPDLASQEGLAEGLLRPVSRR